MKIIEIIKLLSESTEKEHLLKSLNTLDKSFPKNREEEKERFFRGIANTIDDKIGDVANDELTLTARNHFFNSPFLKSFALDQSTIEGLRAVMNMLEPESYINFVSNSRPSVKSGYLKGIFQEIEDYVAPVLKRGRKSNKVSHETQVSRDISTLFNALYKKIPSIGIGYGELLLAMIFGGTKVRKASKQKGDILINNTVYEVKVSESSAIDAVYQEIESQLMNAQGKDIEKLRAELEHSKKKYDAEIRKCTKLVEKFAKVLARDYNLDKSDVKDYFSILTEEDKKRAILYGLYSVGYQNFIICSPRISTTDFDVKINVITKAMIESVIENKDVPVSSIGIDIIDKTAGGTKKCLFGNYGIVAL